MSNLNQTESLQRATAAPFGAYVIEVGGMPAGVLVRAGADFRFFAARREFGKLEGSAFRTPHAAQKAAERMWRAAEERPAAASVPHRLLSRLGEFRSHVIGILPQPLGETSGFADRRASSPGHVEPPKAVQHDRDLR